MTVVLVNPPSVSARLPQEHMGLEYLSAVLQAEGIPVTVIDAYAGGLDAGETVRAVLDRRPDVLGLSPFVDSWASTQEIIAAVKEARPQTHITLGGHLSTLSSSHVLRTGPVDSVVIGEGEATLPELVRAVSDGPRLWMRTPGIAYRDEDGVIHRSARRRLIRDLDLLPRPHRYNAGAILAARIPLQLVTSRGCHGRCTFCSISTFYRQQEGPIWRGRSPSAVAGEMAYLVENYGARVFKIVDDSFVGPGPAGPRRARALAEALIELDLRVEFRLSVRADQVEAALFARLREAGLTCVAVGVEAAFDRALRTYRKGVTVDQNRRALEILRDLGIRVLMNFIVFDPYVVFEELEKQYQWLAEWNDTITHMVSQSLYVRPLDPIAAVLRRENRLRGAEYPTSSYGFDDPRVTAVHAALSGWTEATGRLYYRVVENLMLPRDMSPEESGAVWKIYRRLKEVDLAVFGEALTEARAGRLETEPFVKEQTSRYRPLLDGADTAIAAFLADYLPGSVVAR